MPESLIDLASLQVAAEEFLTAVLEVTAQPILAIDHDGVIRFANPAAISALGYERADELAGHNSHATIHYRHRDGTAFADNAGPEPRFPSPSARCSGRWRPARWSPASWTGSSAATVRCSPSPTPRSRSG